MNLTQELSDVAEECSKPDWDCYGAEPLSEQTVKLAKLFLDGLPSGIPEPVIVPEPTGEISLVWEKGDNFVIVSFDNNLDTTVLVKYRGRTISSAKKISKTIFSIIRYVTG